MTMANDMWYEWTHFISDNTYPAIRGRYRYSKNIVDKDVLFVNLKEIPEIRVVNNILPSTEDMGRDIVVNSELLPLANWLFNFLYNKVKNKNTKVIISGRDNMTIICQLVVYMLKNVQVRNVDVSAVMFNPKPVGNRKFRNEILNNCISIHNNRIQHFLRGINLKGLVQPYSTYVKNESLNNDIEYLKFLELYQMR